MLFYADDAVIYILAPGFSISLRVHVFNICCCSNLNSYVFTFDSSDECDCCTFILKAVCSEPDRNLAGGPGVDWCFWYLKRKEVFTCGFNPNLSF